MNARRSVLAAWFLTLALFGGQNATTYADSVAGHVIDMSSWSARCG